MYLDPAPARQHYGQPRSCGARRRRFLGRQRHLEQPASRRDSSAPSFQRRFFRWRSSVLKLKPRLWQNSLRRIPLLTNSATNCWTSARVPLCSPLTRTCANEKTRGATAAQSLVLAWHARRPPCAVAASDVGLRELRASVRASLRAAEIRAYRAVYEHATSCRTRSLPRRPPDCIKDGAGVPLVISSLFFVDVSSACCGTQTKWLNARSSFRLKGSVHKTILPERSASIPVFIFR